MTTRAAARAARRPPATARLVGPARTLDYLHVDRFRLPGFLTPLEAYRRATRATPPWMRLAFDLRDCAVRPFGASPIHGFGGESRGELRVGDRLDFFRVEAISADQLVLSAHDSHLDMLLSLDAERRHGETCLAATASVKVHNALGRLYIALVGPAHPFVMTALMKEAARKPASRARR